MVTMALMWQLLAVAVVVVVDRSQCQSFANYDFTCEPGFKVASFSRGVPNGQHVGEMSVECEQIGGEPIDVSRISLITINWDYI